MKVVDARSGDVVRVGDVVRYSHDDQWKLLDVDEGILTARALVEGRHGDKLYRRWVPMIVRYTHPSFLFQKVAFFPS